jgi:sarcosine oxidase subunit beta
MTRPASVAIIGGGVMGASVAWHLAKKGVRDVVILDRAPGPAHGSTGRATGGFRAQFSTDINVRLSLYSREQLRSLREETGRDTTISEVGYLWIASSDSELGALCSALDVQRAAGLSNAVEVKVEDIARLNAAVSLDGVVGGTFCESDGYIKPLEILQGYLEGATTLGVTTFWDTRVTGFTMDGDRITEVRTTRDAFAVETVVNAAGPWAAGVAAMAGVALPVEPLRRQAAITKPTEAIPPTMPMTIFLDNGFHLRARDGHVLLCWPTDGDPAKNESGDADDEWLSEVQRMMEQRVPALAGVQFDRRACYSGLYEMSPDKHAIVGFASECANMFLVNGSSGHGVMHSPAIGEIAAAMITGGEPPLDAHQLRPSRFAEGDPVPTSELL